MSDICKACCSLCLSGSESKMGKSEVYKVTELPGLPYTSHPLTWTTVLPEAVQPLCPRVTHGFQELTGHV